jgi:UDP-glucose 6-dehydrogenase
MIKYAANAFLALKISYVNEIGRLANKVGAESGSEQGIGLDKRIGNRFLNAGLGWGGSCFGKDTAALIATARDYRLEMPISIGTCHQLWSARSGGRLLHGKIEDIKRKAHCLAGL